MPTRVKGAARTILCLIAAIHGAACGGAATDRAFPVQHIAEPAPIAETELPADLSPVTAPETVVVVGRVAFSELGKLPKELAGWLQNWRAFIPSELKAIEPFIPKDATLEAAVSVDFLTLGRPEPKVAFSLGLSSLEAVVSALGERLRRVGPGVYRFEEEKRCVVRAALGPAQARIVCSPSGLDELAPYMTRGLPTETLRGDALLSAEVRLKPTFERYRSTIDQLRAFASVAVRALETGDARFDVPLSRAVFALADEGLALTRDLDRVTLSATRAAGVSGLELLFELHYRGSESWTARLPALLASKVGPAPEAFWALPADAGAALTVASLGGDAYQDIARHASDLVDGGFQAEGLSAATRKRAVELVQRALLFDKPSAWASGNFDGRPLERFCVGLVDVPSSEVLKFIEDARVIYADATKKRSAKDRPFAPLFAALEKEGIETVPTFSRKYSTALQRLRGGAMYEFVLGAREGTARVRRVILAVPDGQRTWIGVAPDERPLAAKLASLIGKKHVTLASRSDLAPLRQQPAFVSGFLTFAHLASGFADGAEREGDRRRELARRLLEVVGQAPHQGTSPVFFVEQVRRPNMISAAFTIAEPALVDVAYFLRQAGAGN